MTAINCAPNKQIQLDYLINIDVGDVGNEVYQVCIFNKRNVLNLNFWLGITKIKIADRKETDTFAVLCRTVWSFMQG